MTMGAKETNNRVRGDIVLGSYIEASVQGRQPHPPMFVIETNTQMNGRVTVNDEIRVHQAVIAAGATHVNWEDPFVFVKPGLFKAGRCLIQQLTHS